VIGSDCAVLARRASRELGTHIDLAVTSQPASICDLSPAERSSLEQITTRQRALSWLRGRAALKALIGELGDTDTARIRFPNPRFSLSHSADMAVAAAIRTQGSAGVGIDIEWDRPAPSAAARFYLSAAETAWALDQPDASRELLRLWTIKEALFKADPRNDETVLSDYELMRPRDYGGCCSARDVDFRYLCVRLEGGFVTIAVSETRSGT
jgi:4'-phosphopantetheinyl transferase EntD